MYMMNENVMNENSTFNLERGIGETTGSTASPKLPVLEEGDALTNILAGHLSQQGGITIDDLRIMSYEEGKAFFTAFIPFLRNKYPQTVDTIIEGILWVKSHGLGIILPRKAIEKGLAFFPVGYLENDDIPDHGDLSSLTVVAHAKPVPLETYPTRAARLLRTYLEQRGARVIRVSYAMNELVRSVHPVIDVLQMAARRLEMQGGVQSIDNKEVPLLPEVVAYALEGPSVLFEALKQKERVVVALTGFPGNHAEKAREHEVVEQKIEQVKQPLHALNRTPKTLILVNAGE